MVTSSNALSKGLLLKDEKDIVEAVRGGKYRTLGRCLVWAGHAWEAAHSSPALFKVGTKIALQGFRRVYDITSLFRVCSDVRIYC